MNDELIAGDTLDFLDTVSAYPPADGWTLKYRLVPRFTAPAQDPIDIVATTSGTDYRVQAAAAVTAAWQPGFYTWSRWVEKAGPIRQSLGSGQIRIITNPATAAAGYDSRSHVRKMLDQVQAAMLALNSSVKSFTIGTRQFTYRDMPELIAEESRLKWLVKDEEARAAIAAGQPNPRNVGIRFGRL